MASVLVRSRSTPAKRWVRKRIEQGNAMSGRGQHREQVLPIVSGGLHGDQDLTWGTKQRQCLLIAEVVFGERGCLSTSTAPSALTMAKTCVSDAMSIPAKRIPPPGDGGSREPRSRCSCPRLCMRGHGAAGPGIPFGHWSTGRGRQSHSRGLRLQCRNGDPLPVPSISIPRSPPMSGQDTSAAGPAPRHSPPGGAARSAVRGERTSAAGPPQGLAPGGSGAQRRSGEHASAAC